jgi:Holliday junction resolvase RusA-like endonuclease
MALTFYLLRPKTLPKKVVHHVKTPDLDNLVKGIWDALKGITYADDSQVVKLIASKEYHPEPGVLIIIDEIKEVEI